jgi:ADP-ribose pyrophosphatase
MVVPVEKDGRLLLVRQYRYTGNRGSIEFPCGGVEDGSNCDATARNELVEETGFSIAKMGEVDLEMYLGRNKEAREAKRHLNKS